MMENRSFDHFLGWAPGADWRQAGLAYPDPAFATEVLTRSFRTHQLWRETLRYHANVAYPHELAQVRGHAEWFLQRAREL